MPCGAAVGALEESASRAAGAEVEWLPPHVPHCGIKDVGIGGIHHHLGAAGVFVAIQDLIPGLAAVGGLEDATFLVGIPQVSKGAGVNRVAVLGVNDDAAEVLGIGEA